MPPGCGSSHCRPGCACPAGGPERPKRRVATPWSGGTACRTVDCSPAAFLLVRRPHRRGGRCRTLSRTLTRLGGWCAEALRRVGQAVTDVTDGAIASDFDRAAQAAATRRDRRARL